MRDDGLRNFLRQMNPWWQAAAASSDLLSWTSDDRALRDRAKHDLGYRAPVFSDVLKEKISDALYVVRGPRRVGKSVALKDLIAGLCRRKDLSGWQIIYLATDTFKAHDLRRAIVLALELTRLAPDQRRVWIFDEITAVEGWTAEIKNLRDNSEFGEHTVILTGSSTAGTESAVRDLGAGRTGSARVPFRLLLPMSFRNFLAATGTIIPIPSPVTPSHLQSSEAESLIVLAEIFIDQLDLAWQRYLEVGGFPRAVAEYHRQGAVSGNFLGDLAAWLSADVDPSAPQDSVPLLIAELHKRSSSPLNIRDTATQLGYSRDQLTLRLHRFVNTFAAIWCPQLDDNGRRIAGAQAKFYLSDPLLSWIGHHLRPGLPAPDFTMLSEATIGNTLARALDSYSPGRLTSTDTIGYSRTTSGNEVDFAPVPVIRNGEVGWSAPIESKWVNRDWRSEAKVAEGKYQSGILATKNIVDLTRSVWAIPAPILALLLE